MLQEEEEKDGKRLREDEGQISEKEEKEQQTAKKIRIDEEPLKVVRSSSSSSLSSLETDAEVEPACSPKKRRGTVIIGSSSGGRHGTESKPAPKRMESGILSYIPPELLYHILKFLSSEV